MSAHVVTVRSRKGLGVLASFVNYDFKSAKTTPEKAAVDYVERIVPGGDWYAETIRDVGQIGEVRKVT